MQISLANHIIIPEIKKFIDEGQSVTFSVKGVSMRPMIEGGRDSVVLEPCTGELHIGDVILAEIHPQVYALHRIERIEGDSITMRGDGNLVGTETFHRDAVIGRAAAFIRKGKRLSTDSKRWRVYSAIWPKLLPVRHYILFALHPHIPVRLKNFIKRLLGSHK